MRRLLFLVTTMLLMVQGASAWNGSGSSGDPYQITSTADWNTLASNVANGNTYSNTYFKLTADITVTTMVTATFSGTFDGGGNTLTFNYTATGNNAAPFAYITGATIKNLRVAGTINTGYKFAAGIAAECGTTTITNCQSSVTINSSVDGDGTHGGLIGCQGSGTLTINNCLFDGELMGAKTTGCGGFVGWVVNSSSYHTYISNSLFAPANITVNAPTFCRHKSSTLHLEASTCYYITPNWTASTVQGTNANSMTAAALVTALNNGDKNWCVHRGNAIPVMVNLVINNKTEWDNFSSHAGNYENKYVQLNADITNITAKISNAFQGIFDGNGHTLTVNLSGGGNMAPFQYLNGGTIMNLTVAGSVTSTDNFCSGLVARTSGGVCLIDNCVVNTNNDGVGFVGGVVAHADNATALTISNCIYGGTIAIQPNGNNENYSGGILGWYNNNQTLDLVMTNCLFKGDYTGNGLFHPIGVKKLDKIFKSSNCTNCYYTKNPANIDDAKRTFTDGTKVCELSLGDNIIATGSSCTFDGKTYHLGTVSLSYTPSKSTLFYMIDGNPNLISGNSFTISKDNQAFDAGAVTITAGDTSITYDYGGTNNTILYIDVNNENSNMVTHPWTSEANYSSITSVVIGNGVTSICGKAFAVCPNLTSVSIASTVESIDAEAFSECGKLETVTFTNANESQLTDILPNAFANCVKLSSITIPEGVEEIGQFAFVCCSALVSATLPSTLSTMGDHVFRDCTSLASVFCLASTPPTGGLVMFKRNASGRKIYVPAGSVSNYKSAAYWSDYKDDIYGYTGTGNCGKTSSDNVNWVCADMDGNSTGETMVIYGSGAMADYTQQNQAPWAKSFTTLNIEEGVTRIGNYAFQNCNGINTVNLPSKVTSIGNYAFDNAGLTSATLNSNPTIGNNAFGSGVALTMNLPASVSGDYKWASFYNNYCNFQGDENTTVFKAKSKGDHVTLTAIADRIIPAGTAVVLRTPSDGSPVLTNTSASTSGSYTDNQLKGSSKAVEQEDGNTYYALAVKSGAVGFYKVKSGVNIPAGKAYLEYNSGLSSPIQLTSEFLGFEDSETTGIDASVVKSAVVDAEAWYTLDGRKLNSKPTTKGVYVVNGNKVVIK